jgi:hypothetical protein
VSIPLAGQTSLPVFRKVINTSITAAAKIADRICGTETLNPSVVMPSVWIETITAAVCSRGSRRLGRTTGICRSPRFNERELMVAMSGEPRSLLE